MTRLKLWGLLSLGVFIGSLGASLAGYLTLRQTFSTFDHCFWMGVALFAHYLFSLKGKSK